MPLLAALAAIAAPVLSRILIALGLTALTVIGVVESVTALRSTLMSYLGAAPVAGLQLAGLAGVWEGFGFVLGAITFTVSLWGMTKAVRIAKG